MSHPQKVLVPVDLCQENEEALKAIHRMDFLRDANVHFIYAVQDLIYSEDVLNYSYLLEQRPEIEADVLKKMKELSTVVLPEGHTGKVHYHCVFGIGTKETICRFITELRPELTIIATREKHGYFQSSFAAYLGTRAPGDVLIVRSLAFNHAVFKGKMKVAVGLKFKTTELLLPTLKSYEFLRHAHVELLHVSPQSHYSKEEGRAVIKRVICSKLLELKDAVVPEKFEGTFAVDCSFGSQVAKKFCELTHEAQVDLLVLKPDRTHALGGFIHHQIQHSRANILLVHS